MDYDGKNLSGWCECEKWDPDDRCLHVLGVFLNKASLVNEGDVRKMQAIHATIKGTPKEHAVLLEWRSKLKGELKKGSAWEEKEG